MSDTFQLKFKSSEVYINSKIGRQRYSEFKIADQFAKYNSAISKQIN